MNLFLFSLIIPIYWELFNIIDPKEMRSIRTGTQGKPYANMNKRERLTLFFYMYYGIVRFAGLFIYWPVFLLSWIIYPIREYKYKASIRIFAILRLSTLIFCFLNAYLWNISFSELIKNKFPFLF